MKFGGLVAGNPIGVVCARARVGKFCSKRTCTGFHCGKRGNALPRDRTTINFEILSLYTQSNFQFCQDIALLEVVGEGPVEVRLNSFLTSVRGRGTHWRGQWVCRNYLALVGNRAPDCPAYSLVIIQTALSDSFFWEQNFKSQYGETVVLITATKEQC